jgi:hypothetical protein
MVPSEVLVLVYIPGLSLSYTTAAHKLMHILKTPINTDSKAKKVFIHTFHIAYYYYNLKNIYYLRKGTT